MRSARSEASSAPHTATAGGRRPLIILVAGLAVLAAFLVVTKVVMAPAGQAASPATTVPVAHGVVRTVAGAATAAAKKLDKSTAANQSQTTTTTAPTAPVAPGTPGDSSGPKPNLVRNPFGG